MDQELFESWKKHIEIVNTLDKEFGVYSRLYNTTTENISGFLNQINYNKDSALTIAASGDQAMNLLLSGVKNITCFDINPFMFNQVKLKEASLKELSYEEFLTFYNLVDSGFTFLDKNIFYKIANSLDNDIIKQFEFLYDFYNDNNINISYAIYYFFNTNINHMKKMSNYLNEDNYYKLVNIIKQNNYNINFIQSDFNSLVNKLNNKYDLILLSNISDYLFYMYDDLILKSYYEDILKLINYLNNDGIIQLGYIYTHIPEINDINLFKDDKRREKVFNKDMFDTYFVDAFDDVNNQGYKDRVITYKRKI